MSVLAFVGPRESLNPRVILRTLQHNYESLTKVKLNKSFFAIHVKSGGELGDLLTNTPLNS